MDVKQEPEEISDSVPQYDTQWKKYKREFEENNITVKLEKYASEYNTRREEEESNHQSNTKMASFCSSNVSTDVSPLSEIQIAEVDIKKEVVDYEEANSVTVFNFNDNKDHWFSKLIPRISLKKIQFYRRNYVCSFCFKIFPTPVQQELHQVIHKNHFAEHDVDNLKHEKLPLKMSPTSAGRPEDAESDIPHKKNKTPQNGHTFKCAECGYVCRYLSRLKNHKMIHSGEKPLQCIDCDYSCLRSGDMKRHKMIHSGEKPYKCEDCEYSCFYSNRLKVHRTVHSGEKPFKCDVCDYSCIVSNSMKRHRMIHSGQKPFKCGSCKYSCIRFCDLKRHKLVHK